MAACEKRVIDRMKDETEQLHQALTLAETILRDGEPADDWLGKRYLIGMHAKWLTEKEADQAIISFPGITDAHYYMRYLAQEANLVRFFLALHQANILLVFEEATEQFVAVETVAELVQLITLGTRELQHHILYSPSLHTVFVDAFDIAGVAYVLDGECAELALGTIIQLAQVNGLYILS